MTIYAFDGQKAIPLSALSPDAWTPADPLDAGAAGTRSDQALAGAVPVLFRAIDLRAKAVAGLPFRLHERGQDVTESADHQELRDHIRRMLWLAEASLCFRGAAYFELAVNPVGRNATAYFLSPWTVSPQIDPLAGLRGFHRAGGAGGWFAPQDILHIWQPDPAVELGPGRAPVAVALAAAGMLHALDAYAAAFFTRGGVKITLLSVPRTTPPEERNKLKTWWDGLVRGSAAAFRSVVVSEEVKPSVIGSDPKDAVVPELKRLSNEDVAVALGVPLSLIYSNPLAGGTVAAERLNFYDFTVVPQANIIAPALNAQYLARLGCALTFAPDDLEVYQASELDKAQSLFTLVGAPIMSVDEARQRLGLRPLVIANAQMAQTIDALYVELDLPRPAQAPPLETLDPAAIVADEAAADLKRWKAKALKRGPSAPFASAWIDPEDAAIIRERLEAATTTDAIKAAFSLPEPGADLSDSERRIFDAVRRVLTAQQAAVLDAILDGRQPTIPPSLRPALLPLLAEIAEDAALQAAARVGPDFDPADAATVAGEWAAANAGAGLDEQSRRVVQKAVAAYANTPGMDRAQLVALLRGAFSARRAETLAITEATRASMQGARLTKEHLAQYGLSYDLVWRTAADERVCAICVPRNGKRQGDGWDDVGPGHPRCRCSVGLEASDA